MTQKLLAEDPIFERLKVAYKYPKGNSITHLKVQNASMFLVLHDSKTKSWTIQHIRLQNGKTTDITLNLQNSDSVSGLFLDHTGSHCIVSSKSGENYYINSKNLRAVYLKKFKGHTITAVGWNLEHGTDIETGFILIGTSSGSIYESDVNSSASVMYFKLLTESLSSGQQLPVSDVFLAMVQVDGGHKWVAFICLPGQLHILTATLGSSDVIHPSSSFMGTFSEPQNAILAPMFASKEPQRHRYVNQSSVSCSSFRISPMEQGVSSARYCWINEEGISIGSVQLSKNCDSYDLIEEAKFMKHDKVNGVNNFPLEIEMTEFHVLILYTDKIVAYSSYNYRQYFKEDIKLDRRNYGISRDCSSQLVWFFNENSICKYRPNKEKRFVWKVLMEMGNFVKAREITRSMEDKKPFNAVVKKQAEAHFANKNYIGAAHCFFECERAFDAVVLMFMQQHDAEKRTGLKHYLLLKLKDDKDPVRMTLLVMWIMEICLSELSDFRKPSGEENVPTGVMTASETKTKNLRKELQGFMQIKDVLGILKSNKEAVYRLILSHMDYETHAQLSMYLNDYEMLVRIYLLQNQYKSALNVIKDHAQPMLFYKFAPELLFAVPMEFLKALMDNDRILNPAKLLPAFYKVIGKNDLVSIAFQYFSHIVTSGKVTPPIHSFLIQLYAEHKPDMLLNHLKSLGTNRDSLPYDPGNALRLCIRKKLDDCCVFLYRLEGMYESAVTVSLQLNLELAKECARELTQDSKDLSFMESEGCENVAKHVWLTIARHMIDKKLETSDVLKLIEESNNVVTVGDLLPLFPEFTDIEALKEPLCGCLRDTSKKIKELKQQIRETGEVMDALKKDMEEQERFFVRVKPSNKCNICGDIIMKKPLIMFPCNHSLHSDCFEEYVLEKLEKSKANKFKVLQKEYKKMEKERMMNKSKLMREKMSLLINKMDTVKGKYCLELGSGCSCLPSIAAVKLGATSVVVTDKVSKDTEEIQRKQHENLNSNLTEEERHKTKVMTLDWRNRKTTIALLKDIPHLDLIFGSDIFYDPEVFMPIIETVRIILNKFPKAEFIFAYEDRNEWYFDLEFEWCQLYLEKLYWGIEDDHEIYVYKARNMTEEERKNMNPDHLKLKPKKIYIGIEGGATHFNFVFINGEGKKLAEGSGSGLNLLLEGKEEASRKIASTLLETAKKENIPLPVESIGLGLSGAEDEVVNNHMVEYFVKTYGDICTEIHLTTDAVISIAATFDKGGVVIIAGTGSSCRLLKEDGDVFGCGGWGHLIGDGGSGSWIALKAIRKLFDVDDGLVIENDSIENMRAVILKHFKVEDKCGLLDILYGSKFSKANMASVCEALAKNCKGDRIIEKLFYDAGHILGRHLVAVSKNFDQGMFDDVPVLAIGSIWKSWDLIKPGFKDAVAAERRIKVVSFYELKESPAVGAAILAAQVRLGVSFEHTDKALKSPPGGDRYKAPGIVKYVFDSIKMSDTSPLETDLEKRQRIVSNCLKSRSNCIVLKLDTGIRDDLSPFGFHFEFDKAKYEKRKTEIRRKRITKWFHWVAVYHHKFGIRHLILVGLMVLYTVGGGLIFNAIEAPHEEKTLMEMILELSVMVNDLTNQTIVIASSNTTQELKFSEISVLITDYYKSMLQFEGKYSGSTLHKVENLQLHRTWRFESAVFYAMTLFTTIGYGTIACSTVAGQAVTLIYSAIGIPLMLVVLGDVGNLLLRMCTFIYVVIYTKVWRHFLRKDTDSELNQNEDDEYELPTVITLVIITVYLILCACIVHFFDWAEGNVEGLPMWESFYFSTISFFTIGLGDVMPNNIHYSPFLAAMFLFGLAMVSMINSSFYTKMQDSFFGFMNLLENQLERIHAEHYEHGYEVFQHLSEYFKIAACCIPNIPDVLDCEFDSRGNRSLGIQVNLLEDKEHHEEIKPMSKKRSRKTDRVYSDSRTRKTTSASRERAPTLGVFAAGTEPVLLKAGNLMSGLLIPNMKRWTSGEIYCLAQYGILGWQVSFVKERQWEYENRQLPATGFTDGFQARFPGLYAIYTETPERRRINAMFAIVLICLFLCIVHLMTTVVMIIGVVKRNTQAILPFFFTGIPTVVMCTAYAVLWWSGDIFNEQLTMSVTEFVLSLAINGICITIVLLYYYRLTGQLTSDKPRDKPPFHTNYQHYPSNAHRTGYEHGVVPPWRTEWDDEPPWTLEKKLRRRERLGTPARPITGFHRKNPSRQSMSKSMETLSRSQSRELPPQVNYNPEYYKQKTLAMTSQRQRSNSSPLQPQQQSVRDYEQSPRRKIPEPLSPRRSRRSRDRRSRRRSRSKETKEPLRRKSPQRVSFKSRPKVYERTPESSVSSRPEILEVQTFV
ncbi:hypothetical protein FO519_001828 [Halicephalobus sp. NKZ332]|nr:hypothetical protein FO519_001828 [Halicephalobus sp. NKZ332]